MRASKLTFDLGHVAGRAFVHVLRGLRPTDRSSFATAGSNAKDEIEIEHHRNHDEAIAHCEARAYASAVLMTSSTHDDDNVHRCSIHVLAKHDGGMHAACCIECIARIDESAIAAKIAFIDVREPHAAELLDGFAAGSVADEGGPAIMGAPLRYTPEEDARRLGHAVGEVLAGQLAALADGEAVAPVVGILFAPGADSATITRGEARLGDRWEHCATRQGATIERGAGGSLVISSPKYWGSSILFLLALDVAVKRGQVRTSHISGTIAGYELDAEDARFVAAIHEGVAHHPRAADVLPGFGALGTYRHRDDLWNEQRGGTLLRPLRRVWRAVTDASTSLLSRRDHVEKVLKVGIERDPAKVYTVFGGDVYAMPRQGSDITIVISAHQADYELVCATGIKPEPGYVYFLDQDGDLSRRRL